MQIGVLVLILLFDWVVGVRNGAAMDFSVTPLFQTHLVYDDNVTSSEMIEEGDVSVILSPGMSVHLDLPTGDTELIYRIGYRQFIKDSTRVEVNHAVDLTSERALSPRWTMHISNGLVILPDATILYTRDVGSRLARALVPNQDVLLNAASVSFAYEATTTSGVRFGYSNGVSRYKSAALLDLKSHSVSAGYTVSLTPITSASITSVYARDTVGGRVSESYGFDGGISTRLRPTTTTSIAGGLRYSTEDMNFHSTYNGTLAEELKRGSVSLLSSRSLYAGGGLVGGGLIADTYGLFGSYYFRELLWASLRGTYSRQKAISGAPLKFDILTATGSLIYHFDLHWNGNLSYTYLSSEVREGIGATFNNNKIGVTVSWEGYRWK